MKYCAVCNKEFNRSPGRFTHFCDSCDPVTEIRFLREAVTEAAQRLPQGWASGEDDPLLAAVRRVLFQTKKQGLIHAVIP